MLVVSGQNKYLSDHDPFPQGLGIFDLVDLAWSKDGKYDADAEDYRTPKIVEDWYQDKNLSTLSWSSDQVKGMFLKNPVSFNATTSSSGSEVPSSTATSASTGSSDFGKKSSSVSEAGPIAGGVIGGAVILGVLAGLAYYFWRRNRLFKPSPSDEELEFDQNGKALEHSPSSSPNRSFLQRVRQLMCTPRQRSWDAEVSVRLGSSTHRANPESWIPHTGPVSSAWKTRKSLISRRRLRIHPLERISWPILLYVFPQKPRNH